MRTAAGIPPLLLFVPLLAACGDQPAPRTGGTAVVAFSGGPRAANPLVGSDSYSAAMNRFLLFLPLVALDLELELEPRLAESWVVEGDTAVVFRVREGISWSDGRPTTAADVAFTLERALDPATGFADRQHIAHWRRIQALDSLTVRVSMEPAREPLYGFTRVPILPRHALESVPTAEMAQSSFNLDPVTNGPFRVHEARPGERWVFEADTTFPDVLGGRPLLDRLVWRVIPESGAQEVELRAGEVDVVVAVRAESFQALTSLDGLRGYEREMLSYNMVAWNNRRPMLSDARVRTALGLAVDREQMLQALRGGRGTLAVGPVPPSHWAYSEVLQPLPHDLDRSRELLRAAGFEDRDGDGTVESPTGEPLRISLLIPSASDFNRDLAQVIQSDLANVGVDLTIQSLEFGTLVGRITGAERDFDAVLLGLDADLRLDLRSLFHSAAMEGPFQLAGHRDARLDSVLDALETESDREDARALWAEAQERIFEAQPWTFLYYTTELIVARDRLHGLEADLRGVLHSAPDWWVEEAESAANGGAGSGGVPGADAAPLLVARPQAE